MPNNRQPYKFHLQDIPRLNLDNNDPRSFMIWKMQWEDYVHLSNLNHEPPENQARVLRSSFEGQTLLTVQSLGIPEDKKHDIGEIVDRIEKFVVGRVNVWRQRNLFNGRYMRQGENTRQYIAALRDLASTCQFQSVTADEHSEEQIIGRYISGCLDPQISTRIMEQDELNLDKLMKLATGMEDAKDSSSFIRNKSRETNAISGKNIPHKKQNSHGQDNKRNTCWRCGSTHDIKKCPAFRSTCHKCNTKGHFSKMCTQPDIKKGTNGCKMKKIENLNKCANDPRMMTVSVRSTSELTKKSAQIKMLRDTGSEVTAADKNTY